MSFHLQGVFQLQVPLVQGLPDDHIGNPEFGKRLDVLQAADATRRGELHTGEGLPQSGVESEIGSLSCSVPVNRGDKAMPETGHEQPMQGFFRAQGRLFGPPANGDLSLLDVDRGDDAFPEFPEKIKRRFPGGEKKAAHHRKSGSHLENPPDGSWGPQAATVTDGQVQGGKRCQDVRMAGSSPLGPLQVDHVQPGASTGLEGGSHGKGVIGIFRSGGIVSPGEADHLSLVKIDRGPDSHEDLPERKRMNVPKSCNPSLPLRSGWNWKPAILPCRETELKRIPSIAVSARLASLTGAA